MKRVVCVLGSARRNGNSATIAERLCEAARAGGVETHTVLLNELTFKGCQGCLCCKQEDYSGCTVRDELTDVLVLVRSAEVLILASPIYMGQVTGQLKCFIDRMYGFLKSDFKNRPDGSHLEPGKKCVLVTTQRNRDAGKYDIGPDYAEKLSWFGYETHVLRGLGVVDIGDVAKRPDILSEADALARRILADHAVDTPIS